MKNCRKGLSKGLLMLLIAMLVISMSACSRKDGSDTETSQTDERVLYDSSEFLKDIPEFSGEPYCEVNGNKPDFKKDEIWTTTQESLDPMDDLGRCGTANSCIGQDGMPTEKRGDISEVTPTGWHDSSYDFVNSRGLYNRCHLIAYQLSGDDAIPRNLITGTSYLNRNGMLPFETEIGDYVTETGNHVMYRVTPIFKGEELLARGVHMEAVSVEDGGEGVSFNVYCYNVEPGVEIDYATGDNKAKSEEEIRNEIAGAPDAEGRYKIILNANPIKMKYHLSGCGNLGDIKPEFYQEYELTVDELKEKEENEGWEPCGGCKPDVILGIKE